MKHKKLFKILIIISIIIAAGLLCMACYPLIACFNDPERLQELIGRFGIFGIVILLFLQVLQIIVAIIPGEVIEFVSGALFGAFGGYILCSGGIIIGQWLIFKIMRTWGSSFTEMMGVKLEKYRFVNNERKLRAITFILYFIPGTPKDLLTYVIPMTKMSLKDFLIISSVARIPSVLSSTFAGAAFGEGDIIKMIIIYAAIIVVSVVGILIHNKFFSKKG